MKSVSLCNQAAVALWSIGSLRLYSPVCALPISAPGPTPLTVANAEETEEGGEEQIIFVSGFMEQNS